jgi:hypothetical protein
MPPPPSASNSLEENATGIGRGKHHATVGLVAATLLTPVGCLGNRGIASKRVVVFFLSSWISLCWGIPHQDLLTAAWTTIRRSVNYPPVRLPPLCPPQSLLTSAQHGVRGGVPKGLGRHSPACSQLWDGLRRHCVLVAGEEGGCPLDYDPADMIDRGWRGVLSPWSCGERLRLDPRYRFA